MVSTLADPASFRSSPTWDMRCTLCDQQTPGVLGALQKAEIEKRWPIIKAANIKAE